MKGVSTVDIFSFSFFLFFRMSHGAYGILVPWPGSTLGPWQWKLQFLTTGPPGNSHFAFFSISFVSALVERAGFLYQLLYSVWCSELFWLKYMKDSTLPQICYWKREICFNLLLKKSWIVFFDIMPKVNNSSSLRGSCTEGSETLSMNFFISYIKTHQSVS